MLGWLREPARRDSRRKRSTNAGSSAWKDASSLSATSRSRPGWRARYTTAIPPRPSSSASSIRRSGSLTGEPFRQVLQPHRVAVLDSPVSGVEELEEDVCDTDPVECATKRLRAQVEVPLVPRSG